MRILPRSLVAPALFTAALAAFGALSARPAPAQPRRPILAVFAHPDDERIVGPLLARLAREGRETHLVIATSGAAGVARRARSADVFSATGTPHSE